MDLVIFKKLSGSKVTADSLYDAIVDAIEKCLLKPGDKLPSTRDIALCLGVSRTTVVKSIDSLISRGYLNAIQGAGTWVTAGSEPEANRFDSISQLYPWEQQYTNLASSLRTLGAEAIESVEFDEINFGSQPPDLVPIKQWRKILLKLSDSIPTAGFAANQEVFGYRPLREAIAGFLRRNKGIICDADQIVLDSGVQSVVSPVFNLLMKRGDRVVCEDPGFYGAREQFESLGAHVVPVGVDGEGLIVDALENLDKPAQWLYVAPSCQEPTGVTLSENRRDKLLTWCAKNETAILEDDWDSEFHYRGQSAPALFTLDTTGSVIYFYSFWRLLYPLISIGFLVIPRRLIPVFESYKSVWDRQFTLIEHYALTELITEGHIEKHLRMTWKYYRKQRQSLIYALTNSFKKNVDVGQSSTGMHVVVRFNLNWSNEFIQKCALSAGLPLASTAPYYVHRAQINEFMIRFSSIATSEIDTMVATFARLLSQGT
ncbi:PLP-dependent aminotransferase family protein [soil metagenome]